MIAAPLALGEIRVIPGPDGKPVEATLIWRALWKAGIAWNCARPHKSPAHNHAA